MMGETKDERRANGEGIGDLGGVRDPNYWMDYRNEEKWLGVEQKQAQRVEHGQMDKMGKCSESTEDDEKGNIQATWNGGGSGERGGGEFVI